MSRAIVVAFHKYTPFGDEFYEPILSFLLQQMQKYKDEYETLYLIDSNWNISPATHHLPSNVVIIKVNPSLRYYDAYKEILPQIKEDLVLFTDNDVVIYKPHVIKETFDKLKEGYDVVSICAAIGNQRFPEIRNQSQFSLHWLGTHKNYLMRYTTYEWGPNMPEHETFGLVTKKMINDKVKHFEIEEDMNSIYIDGTKDGKKSKNLGHYHIRAGSTPAYLLACKSSPEHQKTYWEYLNNQPKNEYLRQLAWYWHMGGDQDKIFELLADVGMSESEWIMYCIERFPGYHSLPNNL